MHFLMILIVIIVGIFGSISFLKDSGYLVKPLEESAVISKKIKEEESAFSQFCDNLKQRAEAKKISQAKAQTTSASPATTGNTAPVSVPSLSQKALAFDHNIFGSVEQHHAKTAPASASQSSAGPAASDDNTQSQAQQAKSSSNPIIKTWGGYVSQIEEASK